MQENLIQTLSLKPFSDIVYYPLDLLSSVINRPNEEIIIAFTLGLIMFLCAGLSLIDTPLYRRLYSISLGLFCSFYVFGLKALAIMPYHFIGYASMVLLPRTVQHKVTTGLSVGILFLGHIYMWMSDDQSYNLTTWPMVTVVKMMMLAMNYHDGMEG
jgi:hypothetical protein